ncbi:hypothetical protein [Flavobacterium sp. NRK F7]|uniref:hypothetical protein n=1 Tax=Flavobacterium sp. NRK F7 TaxID=2954930 RepID=UPI0020916B09|nr:hypothetical protein [Flavobacterium sp. NRK F7]MCO6163958.1 hypothetical protein [Flavobacterium sp. NRK F7]
MERKTLNSTAIVGLDNGFIQTPKNVITNAKLKDSAVRLFQLILDTPSNKKVSLEYYRELLGWSKNKLANATKNLQENGFLKITKKEKGKGNGFSYHYTISSFGNLKNETDLKPSEELEEIIDEIQLQETDVEQQNIETVTDNSIDEEEFDNYAGTLSSLIDYYGKESEFVQEVIPFYNNKNIKGMEKVANKYLKMFYNDELSKVKNPESNKKAFDALKDWLKVEVFDKKKVTNLYSQNTANINAKFLMYKMKYRIDRPVDFETELSDFLENPID